MGKEKPVKFTETCGTLKFEMCLINLYVQKMYKENKANKGFL